MLLLLWSDTIKTGIRKLSFGFKSAKMAREDNRMRPSSIFNALPVDLTAAFSKFSTRFRRVFVCESLLFFSLSLFLSPSLDHLRNLIDLVLILTRDRLIVRKQLTALIIAFEICRAFKQFRFFMTIVD